MTERIEKILIANRGECARGIAQTSRNLGITPVVVYTADDKDSLHAKEAQEKHEVPNYTDIPSLIKAAKESGSNAIHPGWGFVSEDPKFAKACEKAKIIFIGPSKETMSQAGNKEKIKKIATELGIPVITSTPSSLRLSRIPGWARRNGLSDGPNSTPMMVKAATSGGGNGNQVISNLQELDKAIETVKRRAKNLGGGSKRVFMEHYLRDVRHIEVQVLGDQHENLVHLGTRDCSVQANQQKIIEEAPAPFLTQEQEKLLYEYALEIAKAIEYSNVGTVEFLVGANGDIFFMEFNPRLQVEHGVTELITGLDLVEQQIRIAQGRQLPKDVNNPKFSGAAIEARVNTQRIAKLDPQRFTLIPSGGKVEQVIFPEGENIRVEHALYDGYEINMKYNPTQAKVIVWSSTREDAIEKLHEALGQFVIKGVETNIPFIIEALSHSKFARGKHTTAFSQELLEELAEKDSQRQEEVVVFPENGSLWRQAGRIEQIDRGLNFRGRR